MLMKQGKLKHSPAILSTDSISFQPFSRPDIIPFPQLKKRSAKFIYDEKGELIQAFYKAERYVVVVS